ncbi:Tetratricopeptide repeat-containing protein [Chitinophaga sp. YR573]|uniref:CHAT domain-containing protein n=1 Tax=Chitinophaga sp. YR573 TaxID=1881040 RepID=UPI0008B21722|nr:CHAT domain-containing tetratricopeptide repeat protein [Chitinophaga sp. YR573]SEW47113.1 Tetratricopeptide repeat-containing protein [Chitinophaga sp. YR573]
MKKIVHLYLGLSFLFFFHLKSLAQDIKNLLPMVSMHENNKEYDQAIRITHVIKNILIRQSGDQTEPYAEILLLLGNLHYKDGHYPDSVQQYYIAGLNIQKSIVGITSPTYIENTRNLITIYISYHKYKEAINLYIPILSHRQKQPVVDWKEYIIERNDLAWLYGCLNDFTHASEEWNKTLQLCSDHLTLNDDIYAAVITNFGEYCINKGRYTQGKYFFESLISQIEQNGNQDSVVFITSLCMAANLYLDIDDTEKARLMLDRIAILQKNFQYNNSYSFMGIMAYADLFIKEGNFGKAQEYYEKCLFYLQKNNLTDSLDHAKVLARISNAYRLNKRYDLSFDALNKSFQLFIKIKETDSHEYAQLMYTYAALFQENNLNTTAEFYLEQALVKENFVNGKENMTFLNAANELASQYKKRANYKHSILLYDEMENIIEGLFGKRSKLYLTLCINKSAFYNEITMYKEAAVYAGQALGLSFILKEPENINYAILIGNLATILMELNKKKTAEWYLEWSKNVLKKVDKVEDHQLAALYNNYAVIEMRLKKYEESEQHFREAVRIEAVTVGRTSNTYPQILSNLALMYSTRKKFEEAQETAIECEELITEYLKENFIILGENDKYDLLLKFRPHFDLAPSILFDWGPTKCSTEFLQKSCNQALLAKGMLLSNQQKVLQQLRNISDENIRKLIDQWQEDKKTLAHLYTLSQNSRLNEENQLKLSIKHKEKAINYYGNQLVDYKQFDFRQIVDSLKKDEVAIEFISFNHAQPKWSDTIIYAAYVMLPGDSIPHFVTLCHEKSIVDLIENKSRLSSEEYAKHLYGNGINPVENKIHDRKSDLLYELIWAKLEPFLEGKNRVYISPTGFLCRINFNALPVDNNHYLIDKYEIRQFNSLRAITSLRRPVEVQNTVLFGDINYGVGKNAVGLPNLTPSAFAETQYVYDYLQRSNKNSLLISGNDATEAALKQFSGHSPTILHILTHGFSFPPSKRTSKNSDTTNPFKSAEDPMFRSGIMMANGNKIWSGILPDSGKEDGVVTAYEIANLDLSKTDLVVLTACKGALGDLKGSEGVFGLQRAFKLAGVGNMILGLWDLYTTPTNQLIKIFYINKFNNKSTHEAFRIAQLEMRRKTTPYEWAGMILIE